MVFLPFTVATIVCPALFPPAHRAQMSAVEARMSTSLPFPAYRAKQSVSFPGYSASHKDARAFSSKLAGA